MDNEPTHPLTLDEAKSRFRLAAQRASPATLVERYPWQATGVALLGGFFIGRAPVQSILSNRWIMPLLLRFVTSALLKPKRK